MEQRIAIVGIVVDEPNSVELLNGILHVYKDDIIGRMGLPYRARGISLISVIMDAPQQRIEALAEQIGALPGVKVSTLYS